VDVRAGKGGEDGFVDNESEDCEGVGGSEGALGMRFLAEMKRGDGFESEAGDNG
jgi:hypothetical protein